LATVITEFPYKIREIENTWIPLSDGTRLAARIWIPENAEVNPVPALFEYIPYRKSDGTVLRDSRRQPYLAGYGYAAVRVDMRGSGDSDGILYDEYLKQEQDDAIEVIAWIAEQAWCDGNIGMHGISWGGFNSLQVAARQPPHLKAIQVIGFTDDRYNDDVHYMGGCVLTSQMLGWAAVMFAYNGAPPDPRFVGERWREMWLDRLENSPPYVAAWLSHQRRDGYWKHGSVGEDYNAIKVPVFAVGGWADSYNNSIPRLLAGLKVPRLGLIGPWTHAFPEQGPPEPAIGFLQESVRWWDHWLKGKDTGIMDEPFLRSYIQDSARPEIQYKERPGKWVADPAWPSPNISPNYLYLNSNNGITTLDPISSPPTELHVAGSQNHLLAESGEWGAYGGPGDYHMDQQTADGQSLTFTSPPLTDPVDILGNPIVTLELSADQPRALVAVRLCDVFPTGESAFISWGLLNLTHRDSHENPEALTPGEPYLARVKLNMCGYQVPPSHRIRVAISSTHARHAWPSPVPVNLSVYTGSNSTLELPIRTPQPSDTPTSPFPPPECAPTIDHETLRTGETQHIILRDISKATTTLTITEDNGRIRYARSGMEVDDIRKGITRIKDDDPLSLFRQAQRRIEYQRGDWRVWIDSDSKMTSDTEHFYLSCELDAYEKDTRVFTKTWTYKIPRDLV